MPVLLALGSALLNKRLKGGLIAVGGLNLGGTVAPVYNAVDVTELAVERCAYIYPYPPRPSENCHPWQAFVY